MNQQQIDALIDFIDESARYHAERVTDQEASGRNYYAAERLLRECLASDASGGTGHG